MVLSERRSVDMYSEGRVKAYESIRLTTTSWRQVSKTPVNMLAEVSHSVTQFLNGEEDLA